MLSVIAGASLITPFIQVLGPMAGVIVGIVAGFAAFMFQKKMVEPAKNHPLIIAIVTLVAAYLVLIVMILAVQTTSIWDTGDGIGEWTGTAEGMEKTGFENIFNSNIKFNFFLVLIPSWMITGWLILDKKKMKPKVLIIIGVVMMAVGFSAIIYSSFVLFPSTEPPVMRPIEGMDYVLFMYRQAFLLGGIIGMFVIVAGIILFLKERTGKRDMRKRK